MEDGVRVGDIDDTFVLRDLGDEVTRVKVVADWHTKSEDEDIGVVLHDLVFCQLRASTSMVWWNKPPQRVPWSRSRKIHRSWPCQSQGNLGHQLGASHRMRRCIRWQRQ